MKTRSKIIIIIALIAFVACAGVYFFCQYLPEKREQAEIERMIKEYYDYKFALYEEENAGYNDYEVDVAFLGDSLTDGYDLEHYYPQYVTANRGIGGETSHGLQNRLKLSLYDLKPKVAVILIGGNNINTMLDNYEDMLIEIQNNLPETKIILVSLTAMGGSWAHKNQMAAYNNVTIKKLAAKYGHTFVDLYTPLFDETTGEIYADYTNDGVHLTPLGYQVFTETLTPYIDALLNDTAHRLPKI